MLIPTFDNDDIDRYIGDYASRLTGPMALKAGFSKRCIFCVYNISE